MTFRRNGQYVTVLIPAQTFQDVEEDLATAAGEFWPSMTRERGVANLMDTHIDEMLNTGGTYKMEAPTLELELGGFRRV